MKKHIPNTLTLTNLLCGCIGIVFALKGDLLTASYLIGIALVCDFLDGFTARLLKVHSEIGKQLDSLADMVTFGVLPSFILFYLWQQNATWHWPYLSFLIPVCSALRLAKFNIATDQSDSFKGLPTPATAIFIGSLVFLTDEWAGLVHNEISLALISVGLSLLMVSNLRLIALKFKRFAWSGNEVKFILIAISILLAFLLGLSSAPLIILAYVILSVIDNVILGGR
ncbi:MAG: CDP-diacylglycerol--serine O-phosphatidyltransferase [Bacteroidota bacterium]